MNLKKSVEDDERNIKDQRHHNEDVDTYQEGFDGFYFRVYLHCLLGTLKERNFICKNKRHCIQMISSKNKEFLYLIFLE